MPRNISRSICIRPGCHESSYFKRLCKAHYQQEHPGLVVREFRFRWNLVEQFEGSIRGTTREEALRLVEKGIVAGKRTTFDQKPQNVELLEDKECP